MKKAAWAWLMLGLMACSSGSSGNEDGVGLQSTCVQEHMWITRSIFDGKACRNFGYADCDGLASDCINYCAWDVCQAGECQVNEDCEWLGAGYLCKNYTDGMKSYGNWCRYCRPGDLSC